MDAPGELGHIVLTRLEPFAQHAALIERTHLLDTLDQGLTASLISVHAPAGYGKSTLIAQWRERLIANNKTVAWLSLDEDDDTPGTFVAYLACALHRAGLAIPSDLFTGLANDDSEAKHRLRRLLNAIAMTEGRVVLILDEFERMPQQVACQVLPPLLSWTPANMVMLIASRDQPNLPVATLRARGMFLEFTTDDLNFSPHEVGALFEGSLSRKELSDMIERTNGWPVALQLLRGWWGRSGAAGRDVSLLEKASPHIAEYLSEEVLTALPDDLRQFLAEASVLDRLSFGAIEQVVGKVDCWDRLMHSERLRPFLISIDRDLGVFRLHPVFTDVLAQEFSRLTLERQHQLRRAAARWYARAGQIPRAVRSALDANDIKLAGKIIEDAGAVLIWIRYGMSRSKAINGTLTPELLDAFPRLRLLHALILAKEGKLVVARREFEKVKALAPDPDMSEADAMILRHDSMMVEETLLINECRTASDAYLAAYEREMLDAAADDHVLQAHFHTLYGIQCHQRGLFDKAADAAHQAIDHYRQADLSHGEFFNYLHLGVINFAQGSPDIALSYYEKARELARTRFPDDMTKSGLMSALATEIAYEQGNISQAKTYCRKALERLRHSEVWYDISAATLVTNTMITLEREGIDGALAALDDARANVMDRQANGLLMLLSATRISCLALAGRTEVAIKLYQDVKFSLTDYLSQKSEVAWREREMVLTAAVRLAARSRDLVLPVSEIEAALEDSWRGRHIRTAIRLGAALCVYHEAMNDRRSAHLLLPRVLQSSASSGYVQPFAEEAGKLIPCLKEWLESGAASGEIKLHALEIVGRLDTQADSKVKLPKLTERENDILRELGRGLSDKTIARELGLTENTVKFHLKNVYAKFRVKSRAEAVTKGHQMGLLG